MDSENNFFEFQESELLSSIQLQEVGIIANRLHNPLVSFQNGLYNLEFYLWKKILGRIIHIHATIDTNGKIKYSSTQIAQEIGNWFVPR